MAQSVVKSVLRGSLDDLPTLNSRLVRIFISSTFTDTKEERNLLLEDVYPRLKAYCKEKHGLEFQVVDMRWGVPEEASDDHLTTSLCLQEIYNCQKLSTGPNFVAFLNQKHGYRPLQTGIVHSEFELLVDKLKEIGEDTSVLETWYRKDTNANPPVYVLQTISSIIPQYKNRTEESIKQWKQVSGELTHKFKLASKKCFEDGKLEAAEKHKYFMSVTEDEIVNGILQAPGRVPDTCLCFVRIIEDINQNLNHKKVSRFIDLVDGQIDSEAQQILSELRDEKVARRLDNIPRMTIKWSEKDGINKQEHAEYLQEFGRTFYTSLKDKIDKAVSEENNLSNMDLYIEVLQHATMAKERNAMFHGREEIIEQVVEYLKGDSSHPLIVFGPSGCGKTSIMAQIARQVRFTYSKDAIVILRFLGTSPDSSNIWRTLRSICNQIVANDGDQSTDIPDEFNSLLKFFHELLQNYKSAKPLVLLLDSLDQLSPDNGAHKLRWLPKKLPKQVKLVISTYTEGNTIVQTLKSMFPKQSFVLVPKLGEELSIAILNSWLKGQKRTLTADQFEIVKDAFKQCSLPLYVNLVFEIVLSWRSYTPGNQCELSSTIHDSINALFSRIETKYGKVLVSRAFAYITASREGLSEIELEDVLSLDDTVLNEVFLYHTPPFRRIPSLLWVRLRHEILSYLSDKEVDETRVFFWYHRQFFETAKERYLSDKQFCTSIHSMLTDYFLGKWHGVPKPFQYTEKQMTKLGLKSPMSEADRKVSAQPIAFTYESEKAKKRYNKRKLNRLPYHLALSERKSELRKICLFNYEWLLSKIRATSMQSIFHDFVTSKHETSLLYRVLKAVQVTLGRNPETLGTEITGHLLPLLGEKANSDERELIEQSLKGFAGKWQPVPYQVCYKTPSDALFCQLHHESMPFGPRLVAISNDSSHILTLAQKNIILSMDLTTGEIEKDHQLLDPNVCKLNIMYSNRHNVAIIGTSYQKQGNPVFLVDVMTGDVIGSLHLEKAYPGVGLTESLQFQVLEEIIICTFIGHSADVFDRLSGKLLHSFNLPAACICISHDEKKILIIPKKKSFFSIYSLKSFDLIAEVTTSHVPKNVVLMNSGKDAVVQYEDSGVADLINIDPNDGTVGKSMGQVNILKLGYTAIENVDVSDDRKYLILKTEEAFVVWNFNANKYLVQFKIPEDVRPEWRVREFVGIITPDNKYFIVGYDNYLLVWDFQSGQILHQTEVGTSRIEILLITPDCKHVVTSTKRTNVVSVWELSELVSSQIQYQPLCLKSSARYLCLDEMGKVALCRGTVPTELVVIDIIQGIISRQIAKDVEVMEPCMTPDGRYAILRKYDGDAILGIWSTQTGQMVSSLPLSNEQATDYTCSNSLLAVYLLSSNDKNEIGLWSIPDARPLGSFRADRVGIVHVFFEIVDDHVLYTSLGEGEMSLASLIVYNTKLQQITFTYKDVLRVQSLKYNAFASKEVLIFEKSGSAVVDVIEKKVVRKGPARPEHKLFFDKNIKYGIDKFRNVYDLNELTFLFQFDPESEHNFKPTRHTSPKIVPDGSHAVWLNISAGLMKYGNIQSRQTIGVVAIHSIPVFIDIAATGILMIGCEDGRIMMLQLGSSQDYGNDIVADSIRRQKTTKDKSVKMNVKPNTNKTKSKACNII